jgi:hypothetical protein
MDKKLYKWFIGMVAMGVAIQVFSAYNNHKEHKANAEERKLNAEERKLRVEDLKRKGNGKVE